MPARQRPRRRLAPGQIAEELYCLDPDRDERAPQLCAETLLTLTQNGYKAPVAADQLRSPKIQRFAVRSLALEEDFLSGRDTGRAGDDTTTPAEYGSILARGAGSGTPRTCSWPSPPCKDSSIPRPSVARREHGCYGRSTNRCCGMTLGVLDLTALSTRSGRSICEAAASLLRDY